MKNFNKKIFIVVISLMLCMVYSVSYITAQEIEGCWYPDHNEKLDWIQNRLETVNDDVVIPYVQLTLDWRKPNNILDPSIDYTYEAFENIVNNFAENFLTDEERNHLQESEYIDYGRYNNIQELPEIMFPTTASRILELAELEMILNVRVDSQIFNLSEYKYNTSDLICLAKYISKKRLYDNFNKSVMADIDGDGILTSEDLLCMIKKLTGEI